MTTLSSPIAIIRSSWRLVTDRIADFARPVLLLLAASAAFAFVQDSPFQSIYLEIALGIAAAFVSYWMEIAIYVLAAAAHAGKSADETTLYRKAMTRVAPLFLTQVLTAMLLGLGFALFILPGLILWSWTSMAQFAVVFENAGPVRAIRSSIRLVRGATVAVLARLICCAVVFFGGAVLLSLGTLTLIRRQPVSLETLFDPSPLVSGVTSAYIILASVLYITSGVIIYRELTARAEKTASAT